MGTKGGKCKPGLPLPIAQVLFQFRPSYLCRYLFPKEASGPEDEPEGEEHEHMLPGCGDVTGGEGFQNPKEDAARHGPRNVSNSPKNSGGEGLEPINPSHGEIDLSVIHAHEDPGYRS